MPKQLSPLTGHGDTARFLLSKHLTPEPQTQLTEGLLKTEGCPS